MIGEQPFLIGGGVWIQVDACNPTAGNVFERHYSRRATRQTSQLQFVGPGGKMVLLTPCARGVFVWRDFINDDPLGEGINCAVFRNEGAGLSSDLILAAMEPCWARWPGRRLYTYVDPRKVRSPNPGYCFKRAGWRVCGVTKKRELLVLEVLP